MKHTLSISFVVGLAVAAPAAAQVTASAPVPVASERPVARPAIAPMAPLAHAARSRADWTWHR